jgi:hypothetical protein
MNLRTPSCCNQNFEGHKQTDIAKYTHTQTDTRRMCQINEKKYIKIYNMTSCKNVAEREVVEPKRIL